MRNTPYAQRGFADDARRIDADPLAKVSEVTVATVLTEPCRAHWGFAVQKRESTHKEAFRGHGAFQATQLRLRGSHGQKRTKCHRAFG